MVGERPLSCRELSNQAGGQSSRVLPEYREVMRADLNIPPPRVTSARVAEVNSGSEDEFQDSKEDHHPRSLAESITATRVPQIATFETAQSQLDFDNRTSRRTTNWTCRVSPDSKFSWRVQISIILPTCWKILNIFIMSL